MNWYEISIIAAVVKTAAVTQIFLFAIEVLVVFFFNLLLRVRGLSDRLTSIIFSGRPPDALLQSKQVTLTSQTKIPDFMHLSTKSILYSALQGISCQQCFCFCSF